MIASIRDVLQMKSGTVSDKCIDGQNTIMSMNFIRSDRLSQIFADISNEELEGNAFIVAIFACIQFKDCFVSPFAMK